MKTFQPDLLLDEKLQGENILFDLDGTLLQGDLGETVFYHTLLLSDLYAPGTDNWFQPLKQDMLLRLTGERAEILNDYLKDIQQEEFEKAYTSATSWLADFNRADLQALTETILLCGTAPIPITCSLENGGGQRKIMLSYGARVKDDMLIMVKEFLEKGALIWMVSASPQLICEIAAEQLGIARERVLGVQLPTEDGKNGRFPWGEAKVKALHQAGVTRALLAFGDSPGDLAMLEMAKYPVVVANGSTRLLQQMERDGWWIYSDGINQGK